MRWFYRMNIHGVKRKSYEGFVDSNSENGSGMHWMYVCVAVI